MAAVIAAIMAGRKRKQEHIPTVGPCEPTPSFVHRIKKNDAAHSAAAKLGKAHRRRQAEKSYMNKKVLAERMALEAEVGCMQYHVL
eukprot:2100692-Rhodomonas_salina.1